MLSSLSDILRDRDGSGDRYPLSPSNTPLNPSLWGVFPTLHGDSQKSPLKPKHHLL